MRKRSNPLIPAIAAGISLMIASRAIRRLHAYSFKDKSVVITGGSRGLGLVLARELAAEGARLALIARNGAELETARSDIAGRGAEVLAIPCDLREREQAERAIGEAIARFDGIDVLINNAGVIQVGPLENMRLVDFEDALRIHMWAPLYTMLAAVPAMHARGGGRIVNISSIGGKIAVPHLLPYSASKFALSGLSNGMRSELAKDNIQVTTVYPGLMRTGSPGNAFFKGRHRAEYAWFAVLDALPFTSTSAENAARQIIEACRRGDPDLTITLQARLGVFFNELFPGLSADILKLVARILPPPSSTPEGDELMTGWESQSELTPGFLTYLSDKAAAENNERPAIATDVLSPQAHEEHAEMVREAIATEQELAAEPADVADDLPDQDNLNIQVDGTEKPINITEVS